MTPIGIFEDERDQPCEEPATVEDSLLLRSSPATGVDSLGDLLDNLAKDESQRRSCKQPIFYLETKGGKV